MLAKLNKSELFRIRNVVSVNVSRCVMNWEQNMRECSIDGRKA